MLGLQIEERGRRIIAVKPPAEPAGIRAGEALVSVNDMPMADGAAYGIFVDQLPADGHARIGVSDEGETRVVTVGCASRAMWRDQMLAAIDAALRAEYGDCLRIVRELDAAAGRQVGHAKLAYECLQAERVAKKYRPGREIAAMYFDIYQRLAAPGRYSAAYRASVRDSVNRAAALLRRYGRDEFAGRLETMVKP